MDTLPLQENYSTADQLIEKVTEFERQLDLDRKNTIDEINDHLGHLLEYTKEGGSTLISRRAESERAYSELEARLQDFKLHMELASMEARDEFEEKRSAVIKSLLHLEAVLNQLEKNEKDTVGAGELHGLRERIWELTAKIESLHLHMNLSGDAGEEKLRLSHRLAQIKETLAAVPSELRNDMKHLGETVQGISKNAFDALKTFLEFKQEDDDK